MHHARTEEEVVRAAYSCVMDGYADALAHHGLPAAERARLLEGHRHAARKAGRRPLVAVTEDHRTAASRPAGTRADDSKRGRDVGGIVHLGLHYLAAALVPAQALVGAALGCAALRSWPARDVSSATEASIPSPIVAISGRAS